MTGAQQAGVAAAIRHFPEREEEIEALARDSERFREICDELAVAEAALATVESLDAALRGERRLEWLSYIRASLSEIERELGRGTVVSITRGSPRR
jgi:hypothetical protein